MSKLSPSSEIKSLFKGRSASGFIPSTVDILIKYAVIFGILGSVFLQEWKEVHPFDTIIIDEAAQGDETETITYLSEVLSSKSRTRFVTTVVFLGYSFKLWLKHLQRRGNFMERSMAIRSGTGTPKPQSEDVVAVRDFYPDSFFFLHEQMKSLEQIGSVVSYLFYGGNVKNGQRPTNTP